MCCGSNIFEIFKLLRNQETNLENQTLLDHTVAYLAQAATLDCKLRFSAEADGGNIEAKKYAKLRVLPDIL